MKKPNVLIIADNEDINIINAKCEIKYFNTFWIIINYNELHRRVSEIRKAIEENNIDFIFYSRNDQVANRISIGPVTRKLRIGYSSFSGIDDKYRNRQMKICFYDFIESNKTLNFNFFKREEKIRKSNSEATFSIIFDTEQLGCARFGLPRILNLLNKYHVRATFFITNLIKCIYPNILEILRKEGHEVGLHGIWHEYLSNLNEEEQKRSIQDMIQDFGGEIWGANFIGRMNENTIQALTENRIKYFVHPLINRYRLLGYHKLRATPSLLHFQDNKIWMLPISLETYDSPWFSIKNVIDHVILQSKKNKFSHISILCHPFRDGNLAHIRTTNKLLHYLLNVRRLKPLTLSELVTLRLENNTKSFLFPEINREQLFKQTKGLPPPQTKQDLLGLIPENLITLLRIVRKGHAIF